MRKAAFSLKIITLGIKSAEKKIFVQIAKRASNKVNLFFMGILPFIFAGLIGMSVSVYSGSAEMAVKAEVSSIKELAKVSPQLAEERLYKLHKEASERYHLVLLLLSCSGLIFMGYTYFKYSYILASINYFEQCMNICGPYFKDAEEKQIISDFALITSAGDFFHIIDRLRILAEANNKHIPPFGPL